MAFALYEMAEKDGLIQPSLWNGRSTTWRNPLTDLPANVLVEILSRLPLKSLLACKCACKYFNDLACPNAYFHSLYSPRATQALVMQFQENPSKPSPYLHMFDPEADLPHGWNSIYLARKLRFDLPKVSSLSLKNSCNGLLYLAGAADDNPNSIIFNPLTNEYVTLPHWDVDSRRGTRVQLLGFDAVGNRYKVMRIFQTMADGPCGIQVHEVGSGLWRDVEIETDPDEDFSPTSSATYLNGVAYSIWQSPESTMLVYFDFDEEEIGEIKMPPNVPAFIHRHECILNCGVLRDCLCLSFNMYEASDDRHCLLMWVMSKHGGDGELWSFEYAKFNTVGPVLSSHSLCHIWPLRIPSNGKILMFLGGDVLFCYDPQNRRTKIVRLGLEKGSLLEPVDLTPSFLPLNDQLLIDQVMVKRA